ncbi:MAG: S8 family peptidase [Candidatus Polarisedimenticolia bacterium]
MRLAKVCGIVLLAGTAAAAGQGNRHGRLAPDLEDLVLSTNGSDLVDIIIQGDAAALDALNGDLHRRGGSSRRRLARGLAATVPVSSVDELADTSGIRHISLDREVVPTARLSQADEVMWPDSPSARPHLDGRGVGVAVIDSGVATLEGLSDGAVTASVDFVSPRRGRAAPQPFMADPYGHGTHVAGIIAGRRTGTFSGVAPGAHVISLRVLDEDGRGQASDVIAALDWCIENASLHGLRVVNLSLGQPAVEPWETDPLAQAVERAWHAGLVVVTSAGNAGFLGNGFGTISSPGHDPLVITVGAVDGRGTVERQDDEVAWFSSRGPTRFAATLKPDLAAPGVGIVSLRVPHSTLDRAMPEARVSESGRTAFFQMSGSSMAAAAVSGAAALMLSGDPTLTPNDIKARLMRDADHGLYGWLHERGAGALDVTAALGDRARAAGSVSPFMTEVEGQVVIAHSAEAWGGSETWSLEQIYGDPASWGEESILIDGFFDDPCLTGEGLVWQSMSGTGLVWQSMSSAGLVWQSLTANGLVWQSMHDQGLVWQSSVPGCPF